MNQFKYRCMRCDAAKNDRGVWLNYNRVRSLHCQRCANEIKCTWVDHFVDELMDQVFSNWHYNSKNMTPWQIFEWYKKNYYYFVDYMGGSLWDGAVSSMRNSDFKRWYDRSIDTTGSQKFNEQVTTKYVLKLDRLWCELESEAQKELEKLEVSK